MQDDLDDVGDVESNDLGQLSARIGEESVAEVGVSGDALSNDRLDLGASGNGRKILLYGWSEYGKEYVGRVCRPGRLCGGGLKGLLHGRPIGAIR